MGSVEYLSGLGAFAGQCLLADGYEYPVGLAKAIQLSPVGGDMVEAVRQQTNTGPADAKAAALAAFVAGDTVLIDASQTDADEVARLLSVEIAAKRIRYPWIYGRQLDLHYSSSYEPTTAPRSLPAGQSYRLLNGIPQGVAQIRDIVVGPFGILRSDELRYTPPLMCGPNFQCSDVGCNVAHHVELQTGTTPSGKFYRELRRTYPSSERARTIRADSRRPKSEYWDVFNSDSIPWLLGNGLTSTEQKLLLERLIYRGSAGAKSRITSLEIFTKAKGKSTPVIQGIDDAQVLQLLLVFSTQDLISHLEYLVDTNSIYLTASEVRTPVLQRHVSGGGFGAKLQMSRAGVRFTSKLSIPLMRTMLQALYAGAEDELSYQLLEFPGSAFERLDLYLRSASKEEVLQRLVFSSRATLERAFIELKYGRFAIPANAEEAQALEARLVWKLGGGMELPVSPYTRLTEFGHVLRGVVGSPQTTVSEEWVTAVRSAGMDFFVEAESVLALAIDFSAWMLTTDHYSLGRESFAFSRVRAKKAAARLLIDKGGDDLSFRESGNPMGTLLQACPVLADAVEEILADRGSFKRNDHPSFAGHTQILVFPFRHTRLVCDLSESSATQIITTLRGVQSHFSRTDVARTRNRLGHPPETFPTAQELLLALDGVLSALGELDSLGLVPTIYQLHSRTLDASRRESRVLRDGGGGEVTLYGPSELMFSSMPWTASQLVVVPGALIEGTIHPVVFRHLEDTQFAEEWSNYQQFDGAESHAGESPAASR